MLYLELDRAQLRSFSNQIYTQIREKILCGDLKTGEALPSTRELSKELCVARNTILEDGDLERHIRHMKKEYKRCRDHLLTLLKLYFNDQVTVYGFLAGMHVVAEFEGGNFTLDRIQRLQESGIYVVPVEKHSMTKGTHQNQIILGYAQLSDEEMEKGLKILKAELDF
jgi:GntR family transcriptional regulator/MocR family aminotransferase